MRYADSRCTYEEKYTPKHVYIFTGKCIVMGKEHSVSVPAEELYAYRRGKSTQEALKSVSEDDREFLLSGFTEEGWELAFGKDEE